MARPSRAHFNIGAIKGSTPQVAWNCTKCGTQGSATNRAEAGKKFDKHECR